MADHIDGPRSIGDPSIDLTDLFAFTSPANAARFVLAVDVFPSAGASALFSNVVNHSIVVRPVSVAGLGDAAAFKPGEEEFRFTCRFGALEPSVGGAMPVQRGTFSLPDGQILSFIVNDESGAATPDGQFRVFAGLRSDPFYLAWLFNPFRKLPNLLQYDNVLGIVVEFDAHRLFGAGLGTLFGAIAETTPLPQPKGFVGHDPPRFDWIGKPEQTNVRFNNAALPNVDDVRDLWNQQTPFAIAEQFKPVFHKRLVDSLANYDMQDGKQDWTAAQLTASANVFLEDFLLFDVEKPITDGSHLEIEKSTLNAQPYGTGGGRTLDANCIDILLTWICNRDTGVFMQGGATGATQPGGKTFPYLAPPNAELHALAERVDVSASSEKVWNLIGPFGSSWNPLVASVHIAGDGVGQLRMIQTIDGKQIIERLEAMDDPQRLYRYAMISGIPASRYTGSLSVTSKGDGSSVEWRVQYQADGQPEIIVKTVISELLKTGLASLRQRFDSAK